MPIARTRWRFSAAALRRPGTVLAALCAGIGAVILLEIAAASPPAAFPPADEPAPVPAGPETRPAAAGPDNAALVSGILQRPLFTPGRRAASPAPDAGIPAMANFRWRLAGTLVTPSRREALFVEAGRRLAAGEGMSVDDWQILSIRPDGVTLGRGGVRKEMKPAPDTTRSASGPEAGALPVPQPALTAASQRARRFFRAPPPLAMPPQAGMAPPKPPTTRHGGPGSRTP